MILSQARLGHRNILPRLLQKAGVYTDLMDEIRKFIPSHISLSMMHKYMSFEEIALANIAVNEAINKNSLSYFKPILHTLGHYKRFYANENTVTRFFTPFDFSNGKECDKKAGIGKVRFHGPHRDNWYSTSENSLNLWCALTDVFEGNSMVIYPDMWDVDIPYEGKKAVQDRAWGKPERYVIEEGDALLFHARHLHTTELNVTDRTRVVITFRFSTDKPVFSGNDRQRYYDSRFIGTPIQKIARSPLW